MSTKETKFTPPTPVTYSPDYKSDTPKNVPIPEVHDVYDPMTGTVVRAMGCRMERTMDSREEMEKTVARASLRDILNDLERLKKQVLDLQTNNTALKGEMRVKDRAFELALDAYHDTGSVRCTKETLKKLLIEEAVEYWKDPMGPKKP